MKREYDVYYRLHKQHSQYLGTIKSANAWYAFKKARQMFSEEWGHSELEEFYVTTGKVPNVELKGLRIGNHGGAK